MKNKRGVTLIVLAVTIIILLILAGITVSGLIKKNSIIDAASHVKKVHSIETEREYLQKNTVLYQTQGAGKVGVELKQRNLKNSIDWHLIKTESGTFSEGWNFVGKGDELTDFGEADNNWLVNYETGEVVLLEDDKFLSISPGDMLAVKDNIIINVDSSIIDNDLGNNKESLEAQLGEGVTLENFNYNEQSGLTTTSFNFDGIDDYIKIKYNEKKQKEDLAKQGLTFEFYGILDKGESYLRGVKSNYWYNGIFCYWNGDETKQSEMRFGFGNEKEPNSAYNGIIRWNAAYSNYCRALSDWYIPASEWNIEYDIKDKFKGGDIIYFSITLDTRSSYKAKVEGESGDFYKQRFYVNGNKLYDGNYNKKQWDEFVSKILGNLNYFCIGRSSMNQDHYWHYSKMQAYALRLYSKGLSEKEVMDNYKKTVEYHNKLEEWAK